ncbi:MAG: hypothetical protein IJ341_11235 [Bacteroidales bacterium]|nr:hypothetical protein [Bacteroidales bacterium]
MPNINTASEKILHTIKRYCSKGVRRVTKRRGFGVHSPFVFNFIIRVIEEKAQYYSYSAIEAQYFKVKKALTSKSPIKLHPLKFSKLIFRVANRLKPTTVLECGTAYGVSTIALSLSKNNIQLTTIEPNAEIARWVDGAIVKDYTMALKQYYSSNSVPDLIYIRIQEKSSDYKAIYGAITPYIKENSAIIVAGIRTTKENYSLFKEFSANPIIKVTIDLYDTAILVASPKLNKQQFKVSF